MTFKLKDNLGKELDAESAKNTIWYNIKRKSVHLLVEDTKQKWHFVGLSTEQNEYGIVVGAFESFLSLVQHLSFFEYIMIYIGRIEDLDIESFVAERYNESTI